MPIFYFRGARQLWTLYRQLLPLWLLLDLEEKETSTNRQNSKVSSHSIIDWSVRFTLPVHVFGQSVASVIYLAAPRLPVMSENQFHCTRLCVCVCVCVCVCACACVCVSQWKKLPDEWQARQATPAIVQVSSSKHNAKKITRVRARAHYVFFRLTQLRFSKFPWRRRKNGENAASNAIASTQRRRLRRRRCVCFFLRFLSFDDPDHRSLTHLLRETFDVESFSS